MSENNSQILALTADIASAYVSRNKLDSGQLGELIRSIHASLATVAGAQHAPPPAEPRVPAVPIKKSVTPDYLICLEDGQKFKSIRRHLRIKYGLSPEQYRAKWGLPSDYPMVAPNYAAARSSLAKAMGLGVGGRKRQKA